MFAELHREAMKRAGVQPGKEALDNELGAKVEPCDLADDLGTKIFLGSVHKTSSPQRAQRNTEKEGTDLSFGHQQSPSRVEKAFAVHLVNAVSQAVESGAKLVDILPHG